MEVGAMTEEVTVVEPRERAADDERRALVHARERGPEEHRQQRADALQLRDARAGRAASRAPAAARSERSSGFTVNGQRPNSNNMTIDGVANIDTGNNGGNMATTNIDSVAEFKVLTNAYQAEYGRAVGGQVQVVTKSGSRDFHGSGYWYGRRSDWNANTWTNKRVTPEIRAGQDLAQRLAATPSAGRSSARASTRTRRSCSSSSARSSSAARTRRTSGRPACPPPSSGAATSRRASTPAATRSRTSATISSRRRTRPGVQRGRHSAPASPTAACSDESREPSLSPGLAALNIYPDGELLGRQRPQLHEPGPQQRAAARRPAADGLPGDATSGGSPAAT